MNKLFTPLFMIAGFVALSIGLQAQQNQSVLFRFNRLNYITPRNDYGSNLKDKNWDDNFIESDFRAMEFGYIRQLKSNNASLVIPFKIGAARLPNHIGETGDKRQVFTTLDALIQHSLFKQGRYLFNPYFNYGIGAFYNWDNNYWNSNLPISLGFNFKISDGVYLNGQTQFRLSSGKHPGWHHGLGLVVDFGKEEKPVILDRDGDGVIDINDVCPDEAGLAALNGCPDRDMDGVADKDDKCPDVLGLAALMGCPDKDSDGIADSDDACPDQKGIAAFNGCPDTDGDGVQDKDDACPREKGLVSLKGCPDKDGDGLADKDDACPTEKGPVATKGCPDRDGDGVTDKEDTCPDKKGDPAHKGCPDTDKDGTYDNEDRCVDKPGPPSNKGCPELKKEDKAKLASVIKNVQFETGKAALLAKSNIVLDEVVALMNQYPEYSLTISGHTDDQGDEAKNLALSEARAKTCLDYLVAKNIAASRMTFAGYGETKPIADNKTKAGRDTNRRVDFDLFVK